MGAALVVFVALNPYLLSHFDRFWDDIQGQADVAANEPKPGQESGGVAYYLESLTWGLGWLVAIAAAAGAALEFRRDLVRGLVLVSMPVALFVYLSVQSRYFGRWLLPAYPVLAMLAAVALVRASELVRAGPLARAAALAGITLVALAQPLAADIRTGQVLGRDDTREQVRSFLAGRAAAGAAGLGRARRARALVSLTPRTAATPRGCGAARGARAGPSPAGATRARAGARCARSTSRASSPVPTAACGRPPTTWCSTAVIDDYRFYGYCLVVTYGVVPSAPSRPATRRSAPTGRLEREQVLRTFSPYDEGAEPVPFSFDLSYNSTPRLPPARPGGAGLPAAELPPGLGAADRPRAPRPRAAAVRAPARSAGNAAGRDLGGGSKAGPNVAFGAPGGEAAHVPVWAGSAPSGTICPAL